jgi:4-azaleucine resistance transporter AzlC
MTGRQHSPLYLGIAILLGYFSIAVAFGVAGRDLDFSLPVLAGLSIFVFAGASQFLAVQLLSQGVGGVAVIAATFILNARHIVMSFAMRNRIRGDQVPRPLLAFGITDEVFTSAATRAAPIRDTELLAVEGLAYLGWVSGTVVGFVVGNFIPPVIEAAMGIALYAMFIALIVPGILRFWRYGVVAATAGVVHFGLKALATPHGPALLLSIVLPALVFAALPAFSEET